MEELEDRAEAMKRLCAAEAEHAAAYAKLRAAARDVLTSWGKPVDGVAHLHAAWMLLAGCQDLAGAKSAADKVTEPELRPLADMLCGYVEQLILSDRLFKALQADLDPILRGGQ